MKLGGGVTSRPPPLSSHSVKKAQPALPVSKIDERLEQYTQAVEVCKALATSFSALTRH